MTGLQIHDELANPAQSRMVRIVTGRLPAMRGLPIRLHRVDGLSDPRGPVHGGSFLRERRIAFDCTQSEFPRILVHELFHFVWLRLANSVRLSWEECLRREARAHVRGELGWSAEWRKKELRPDDIRRRTRAWRLYCCESFCDSAAWLYSGIRRHEEFTLAGKLGDIRRRWFLATIEPRELSI